MDSPLETLLGNRTAPQVLLYLIHYGEAYGRGVADDLGLNLRSVQVQLDKLESAGFLVSKEAGRTRVYSFNQRTPAARALRELVEVFYSGLSPVDREQLFGKRRRPRRRGKPVRE